VSTLVHGIQARREIYEKYGIQFGQKDYFAGTDLPAVVRKILEEPASPLRATPVRSESAGVRDRASRLAEGRSLLAPLEVATAPIRLE